MSEASSVAMASPPVSPAASVRQTATEGRRRMGLSSRSLATTGSATEPQTPLDSETATLLSRRFKDLRSRAAMKKDAACSGLATAHMLASLAKEVGMSKDDVVSIYRVFETYDTDKTGRIDVREFEKVVYEILQQHLPDEAAAKERAKSASEWYWWGGETDQTGTISFVELLKWYRSSGFKEDMLLSDHERRMRQLAKKFSITPSYLDRIRQSFDKHDSDRSGQIDIDEFEQILHKALKIPDAVPLPSARVQYFWSEIDSDGSGKVRFEEFLQWWLKYFNENTTERAQIHDFYRGIRRIGVKHLDPPAYAPAVGANKSMS